jgi:hypothetical protein
VEIHPACYRGWEHALFGQPTEHRHDGPGFVVGLLWTYRRCLPSTAAVLSADDKVDSTTTRYVAKNIGSCVATGMIQVAAEIVAQPMNIGVPEKTRAWSATALSALVQETFDLRPKALSETCCAGYEKPQRMDTLAAMGRDFT